MVTLFDTSVVCANMGHGTYLVPKMLSRLSRGIVATPLNVVDLAFVVARWHYNIVLYPTFDVVATLIAYLVIIGTAICRKHRQCHRWRWCRHRPLRFQPSRHHRMLLSQYHGRLQYLGGVFQNRFPVFVLSQVGYDVLDLLPNYTIQQVKVMVAAKTGIPRQLQRLVNCGKHLQDTRTVQSYHLRRDSTIVLLLSLPGGMQGGYAGGKPASGASSPQSSSASSSSNMPHKVFTSNEEATRSLPQPGQEVRGSPQRSALSLAQQAQIQCILHEIKMSEVRIRFLVRQDEHVQFGSVLEKATEDLQRLSKVVDSGVRELPQMCVQRVPAHIFLEEEIQLVKAVKRFEQTRKVFKERASTLETSGPSMTGQEYQMENTDLEKIAEDLEQMKKVVKARLKDVEGNAKDLPEPKPPEWKAEVNRRIEQPLEQLKEEVKNRLVDKDASVGRMLDSAERRLQHQIQISLQIFEAMARCGIQHREHQEFRSMAAQSLCHQQDTWMESHARLDTGAQPIAPEILFVEAMGRFSRTQEEYQQRAIIMEQNAKGLEEMNGQAHDRLDIVAPIWNDAFMEQNIQVVIFTQVVESRHNKDETEALCLRRQIFERFAKQRPDEGKIRNFFQRLLFKPLAQAWGKQQNQYNDPQDQPEDQQDQPEEHQQQRFDKEKEKQAEEQHEKVAQKRLMFEQLAQAWCKQRQRFSKKKKKEQAEQQEKEKQVQELENEKKTLQSLVFRQIAEALHHVQLHQSYKDLTALKLNKDETEDSQREHLQNQAFQLVLTQWNKQKQRWFH